MVLCEKNKGISIKIGRIGLKQERYTDDVTALGLRSIKLPSAINIDQAVFGVWRFPPWGTGLVSTDIT